MWRCWWNGELYKLSSILKSKIFCSSATWLQSKNPTKYFGRIVDCSVWVWLQFKMSFCASFIVSEHTQKHRLRCLTPTDWIYSYGIPKPTINDNNASTTINRSMHCLTSRFHVQSSQIFQLRSRNRKCPELKRISACWVVIRTKLNEEQIYAY